MAGSKPSPESVGLPIRPFLFTLDQVSTLVQVGEERLKRDYIHYDGRSIGVRPRDRMVAHNIAPEGVKPEWRVAERELIRWLKSRGFRVYDRGWPVQ
jgi:hypothetical protein